MSKKEEEIILEEKTLVNGNMVELLGKVWGVPTLPGVAKVVV